MRGRLGGADGHPEAGQEVHPRRGDIVGDRVRGAEPAGGLHEDKRVQGVDQHDYTVLISQDWVDFFCEEVKAGTLEKRSLLAT